MSELSAKSETSTEGMVDYNANSSAQQTLVHLQAKQIQEIVAQMGEVHPEFKIVDYGCGPGRSTIDTVTPAINAYRARFPDAPIVVCHSDQAGNDWNALFEMVNSDTGYLKGATGIRSEAAVGSFYDQVTAAQSVSLATCFAASHWSSHAVQIDAPGSVWFADLTGDARRVFAEYAQADWATFLRRRAAELQSGGYLLVGTLGSVPEPGEINDIAASGRGIYRAIQHVAQGMVDDGLFDTRHLDAFLFSLWFLTAKEAAKPLETEADLREAFEIRSITVDAAVVKPTDIFDDFLNEPGEYARKYLGYTRAFADSTLRRQLFEPAADTSEQAEALLAEFYKRFEALYAAETSKYACEMWHLVVVLKRR